MCGELRTRICTADRVDRAMRHARYRENFALNKLAYNLEFKVDLKSAIIDA